jgi:predicted AlkP superfamily phosphohydrolase/phosphomutase
MRVLILGIDALEYNRVEEWDLKNLKQKEYGKTQVPFSEGFGEPVTLVVWPSFISGSDPEIMGFDAPIIYRQPLKFVMEKIYFPLTSNQPKSEHEVTIEEKTTIKNKIISRLNYFLMKAGMGRYPERKDIKPPTFFDNPNYKSLHFNIPVYDKIFTTEERDSARSGVIRAISDKDFRKTFEKKLSDELETGSKNVFEQLKKPDWDLCMQYFYVLDGIQHVFYKNKIKVMNYYIEFNQFVGKVKEKLPEDTMLFIVSDHGGEFGLHTNYGFYSSNIKLGLKNPKISEFKDIIENKILN